MRYVITRFKEERRLPLREKKKGYYRKEVFVLG